MALLAAPDRTCAFQNVGEEFDLSPSRVNNVSRRNRINKN
jgi:hypothetical protein